LKKKLTQITSAPEAYSNLCDKLDGVVRRALTPAPRLSLAEWCNRHRILSPESSPEPGPFSTERAPYQFEMLDACGDYRIEGVVMMCGAQLGKSTLIENVIASYMAHDPAPMLVVFPELNLGKAFMTERLDPMIRDTPALKGIVRPARSRDSGNTQQKKRFVGGQITIVGSNAASGLSSRPIRVLLMDEVDRFAVSAGDEGDPVKLASARTANFWNKKIIMASTPTNKGFSRIEKEFAKSDQRYYEVPCPHCDFYARLRFQKPKDGVVAHWVEWDDNNPDTAHLVCCNCAAVIEEVYKRQMLRDGRWVATAPGNSVVGFCISTLYSPWLTWANLAKEWLGTHGDTEARKVFINTKLCELWEDRGERLESHHLAHASKVRPRKYPLVWELLVAGVDVQADRIEVAVWGYGERLEMLVD
jgi:phage terminase large subunit GpA-like protein